MSGCRDIGELAGPVLVCGGAYSNLEATRALADLAAGLAIPAGNVIHTGDAVAYCADPGPVCDLVIAAGWRAIAGNVERQLGDDADDCDCGFAEGSACDVLARDWYAHARATTTARHRAWMRALPDQLAFTIAGVRFRVVHGAPSRCNRFMFASLPQTEFAAEIDLTDADVVIAGHTGIAFTRPIAGRVWHNCGALGLPANDGTPRGWYSLIEPCQEGLRLSHHALCYDHSAAAAAMRARGLAEGYATALETGLWPSTDILPPPERAATGRAIAPAGLVIAARAREPA